MPKRAHQEEEPSTILDGGHSALAGAVHARASEDEAARELPDRRRGGDPRRRNGAMPREPPGTGGNDCVVHGADQVVLRRAHPSHRPIQRARALELRVGQRAGPDLEPHARARRHDVRGRPRCDETYRTVRHLWHRRRRRVRDAVHELSRCTRPSSRRSKRVLAAGPPDPWIPRVCGGRNRRSETVRF